MDRSDSPPAFELIIAREAHARDAEAGSYTERRAEDAYERAIEEAAALAALDLQPDDTVLDAGCGTGQHVEPLLRAAGRLIAVDHSARSVRIAAGLVSAADASRAEFHAADLRELPVGDGEVDAVLSVEVLQHIPTQALRLEALRELRRVLRPGGRAAIVVYRWRGHIRRHREGYFPNGIYRYAFTGRELRRNMAEAGFADVRVGGLAIAPKLTERLGVGIDLQRRLVHNPLARPFAHYQFVTAVRPT